jgi:hypothetical protein
MYLTINFQAETHKDFSKMGTFALTTTQPPRQSSASANNPYGTPLRNKASLSPPVAIASIFGIPMNITFIQVTNSFIQFHN